MEEVGIILLVEVVRVDEEVVDEIALVVDEVQVVLVEDNEYRELKMDVVVEIDEVREDVVHYQDY